LWFPSKTDSDQSEQRGPVFWSLGAKRSGHHDEYNADFQHEATKVGILYVAF